MKKALLLSSSGYKDTGYLTHAKDRVNEFLKPCKNIIFIPFAGVKISYSEYEQKVKNALSMQNITSIHMFDDKKEAIQKADAIMVGGGNTFELLNKLYEYDLVELIRKKVESGVLYVGWSAGSNVAGATIKTTNDMPIVVPKSFDAFGIFPYQINPHFIGGKIPGHNGESREERLEEYLILNQKDVIYALPEGCALEICGDEVKVINEVLKITYPFDVVKITDSFKIGF